VKNWETEGGRKKVVDRFLISFSLFGGRRGGAEAKDSKFNAVRHTQGKKGRGRGAKCAAPPLLSLSTDQMRKKKKGTERSKSGRIYGGVVVRRSGKKGGGEENQSL